MVDDFLDQSVCLLELRFDETERFCEGPIGAVLIVTKQLAVVQDNDGLHVLYREVLKGPHIVGVDPGGLRAAIRKNPFQPSGNTLNSKIYKLKCIYYSLSSNAKFIK